MAVKIGVLASEHIAVGAVENNKIVSPVQVFPESSGSRDSFWELHAEEIAEHIHRQISLVRQDSTVDAIGIGFPGIIRDGVVEESPNLPQMKGHNVKREISALLAHDGIEAMVHVLNDADAIAAGIAATRDQLDRIVRVWFLGNGVGYGRYPQAAAVGEGGHMVVTLDPKENLCQCGGIGHLEGIMGHRAMRLRFLDMEPDEVFEQAKTGNARCGAFVELWHRALAAATATSIHIEGPGKFFISGPNARFVQTDMLQVYLHEMVKMSPLQGSAVEVVATSDEIAIIGAAVSAERAASVQ
ncbi:MAG TPA: ROK family protein [Blastocatellia bacterium]|nr:ROK family protein [Blastocatellia bacterium]